MKKKPRRKGRRVPVQEEWCLGCGVMTWREVCNLFHMDLQYAAWSRWKHRGIQGKICSTRILMKRRHRLWRDICSQWELRHMTCRIMCANERRPCMSSRRHPWDNTYMRSLMKIWTFATRLIEDDKITDGCEMNFWKRFKIEDLGIQWSYMDT